MKRSDAISIGLILFFCLSVWWPTRTLPYHWDSAGYIIRSAHRILESRFNTIVGLELFYAHPPLLTVLLASVWMMFGESQLQSHFVMLPVLPLLMLATYAIGRKLENWRLGLAAAFMVGAMPAIVAEYGMIYVDLPMAAFVTAAAAASMYSRWRLMGIFLSLAVLTKLPGVLGIPIALLLSGKEWRTAARWCAMPVIALGIWLMYHHGVNGWWVVKPSLVLTQGPLTFSQIMSSGIFVGKTILLSQARFLLLALGIFGSAWITHQSRKRSHDWWVWVALVSWLLVGIGFFSFMREFALRYVLFLLPAYVLACLWPFYRSVSPRVFYGVVGLFVATCVWLWKPSHTPNTGWVVRPPDDLTYQDMIAVGKELAGFLEREHPTASIYGYFPEIYQVSEPFQGYVSRPLSFTRCSDFVLEPSLEQIVYIHTYSPGQEACHQVVSLYGGELIKQVEINGTWEQLYMVGRATTSSALQK